MLVWAYLNARKTLSLLSPAVKGLSKQNKNARFQFKDRSKTNSWEMTPHRPQLSGQNPQQAAQETKSETETKITTSLQVRDHSRWRVLTSLMLFHQCACYREEKARTLARLVSTGGGKAGRGRVPHLAVFASAKLKPNFHSDACTRKRALS